MYKIIYLCLFINYFFNTYKCEKSWSEFKGLVEDQSREELFVSKVTAETVYSLERNVTTWKSLCIGPECFSVGIYENGLQILKTDLNKNNTDFRITTFLHEMKKKPLGIVIFHNIRNFESEAVVAVSFLKENKISWFRILNNITIEEFWSWPLEHPVEHFNIFKIGLRYILLYTTKDKQGFLYEFDTKNNKYWYLQTLSLDSKIKASALNKFKSDYFLSVVQENKLKIFKYKSNTFQKYLNYQTPGISIINSFNIGFKTFFAINGQKGGIYEFTKNGVITQYITNSHLNGVNFWLPLPIQIYKDDVLLLLQRVLDHSTHKSYEVDVVTYNNGKFEEHEDIPCSLFEEESSRLTCLTLENGIFGASYVIIEDQIGLIVPRSDNSFILFKIHVSVRQKPNPIKSELNTLLEMKKKIEVQLKEQQKIKEEILTLISNTVSIKRAPIKAKESIVGDPQNLTSQLTEVEKIGREIDKLLEKAEKLAKHEKKLKYENIIINNNAKFNDEVIVEETKVNNIDGYPANAILEDIVRNDNINKPLKNKTFTEIEIENLIADNVNNIYADDIAYKDDPEIIINGSLIFENSAMIQNIHLHGRKPNDVIFEDQSIILGKTPQLNDEKSRNKRSLIDDDTIFIPHNLTVRFINGINFTEFVQSLCMTNIQCNIPGTVTVTEKVVAENVSTNVLNGLKFPDEYVFKSSKSDPIITGKKVFKNSLSAHDIRSETTINGVNTNDLFTLSTEQDVGNLTFKNIQITEEFDVDGDILGEYVDKFLANPTLKETNHIRSNANFKNLFIKGNIIIEDKFINDNYKELLKSIVYSDESKTIINSSKDFPHGLTVENDLLIKSKSINNLKLNNLIKKNTDQDLHLNLLKGNVMIKNLILKGKFDGKNITELDESVVKLSGDQFVSSTLTFDDLYVEKLEIEKKLNDLTAEEYLFTNGNGKLDKNIFFNNLHIENLEVTDDLDGTIDGFDLQDIKKKYLSRTKNQTIEPLFIINKTSIDHLTAKNINDKTNTFIFEDTSYEDYIKNLLNNGHLKVENLEVDDSINITSINNNTADNILPLTILEIAAKNGNNLYFENDIYISDIHITNLSSVDWNKYVEGIIYKNQTNVIFDGAKKFENGISVKNLIETKKINNIRLENILTKEGEQIIRGPITINGDVSFENINIQETLNDQSINEILQMISVDGSDYHVKRDMIFKRLSYIQHLEINGFVNNKNIKDVIKDLVYKDNVHLKHDIIFTKAVNITGNLAISNNFNEYNFSDISSKIVLTTQDSDIESIVSFSKSINVLDKMKVDDFLLSKFITGFNTREWIDRAIFVNRGLLTGHYQLNQIEIRENLETEFLNNVNMSKIIPLRSNQSIDYLHFKSLKVLNNIPVGKTVNGRILAEELENTLMTDIDQDISPTTIFNNNTLIRQNLRTKYLNNKPTLKIVTTNSKQTLTAQYIFNSKAVFNSDLNINGLINEIDFDNWVKNSTKLKINITQHISGNWNISKELVFMKNMDKFGDMNGLDLSEIAQEVQNRRNMTYMFEQNTIDDYNEICEEITKLYEKAKSQIYTVKYFDDFQKLSFETNIKNAFHFTFNKVDYLLVNLESCFSYLMIFNETAFEPFITNVRTGQIEQIVSVKDSDILFLVARGNKFSTCDSIRGTNILQFDGENLELKFNMEDQDLIQGSKIPFTFYTLNENGVSEYKITKNSDGPVRYRKWDVLVNVDEASFIPLGFQTGLSLSTGENIIYLDQSEPALYDFEINSNVEAVIKGSFRNISNRYIPGKNKGDIAVLNVGLQDVKKNLLAVASDRDTSIAESVDFIKIYKNPLTGELFDKIQTFRPSSLLSMDFNQGETLLAFLENKTKLAIYEYKGITRFQRKTSIKVYEASFLFQMDLNKTTNFNYLKLLGIVNKNNIRLLKAVMEGNKVQDNLKCEL